MMGALMSGQGSGGNVIAALCNVFIPGLGQLVQGRIFMALFFFVATAVSYALGATVILFFMWLIGAVFHLWSIIDAARFSRFRVGL
jgi:TM2 domain-containing membrane protein YozV